MIRGNVVRHVGNASDTSLIPLAIYVDSCPGAIVADNDINLNTSSPIRHYTVGNAKYFHNQSPDGKLIQGYYYAETRYWNELTTVLSPTAFTYDMGSPTSPANTPADGGSPPSFTYAGLWQVWRLIVENNIIEMRLDPVLDAIPDPRGNTTAIDLFAGGAVALGYPYVFQEATIRRNVVRHVDNALSNAPAWYHFGIYL